MVSSRIETDRMIDYLLSDGHEKRSEATSAYHTIHACIALVHRVDRIVNETTLESHSVKRMLLYISVSCYHTIQYI
jgi:hypothetical protein